MSSHVLPTWAAHVAAHRRPAGMRLEDRRAAREAFTDRTGIIPKPIRQLEGLAVIVAVVAASALATAATALSPPTPLAAQTLTAERTLAAERASSPGRVTPPVWQPQLDRMLPILPPRPAESCGPPAAC